MATEKLTKIELKTLQETIQKINQANAEVGRIESQKHKIMHNMSEVEKDMDDLQKQFEEKYGKISIDINNGEITQIPEEDE